LNNPNEFFINIGIDPQIIDDIPCIKATEDHTKYNCLICCEDLHVGQDILPLKCNIRYLFT